MKKIAVLNLGISNLTSVLNVLEYIGLGYDIVDDAEGIKKSEKLILPGVGTFAAAMHEINKKKLALLIKEQVIKNKIPIFGICLGMQILFEKSEESPNIAGLSILEGEVVKIPNNSKYQIPRIGWSESRFKKDFLGFKNGAMVDFYYVHGYHANPQNKEIIAISSEDDTIISAVSQNNIYGCQFHPEKSYIQGIELFREFSKI